MLVVLGLVVLTGTIAVVCNRIGQELRTDHVGDVPLMNVVGMVDCCCQASRGGDVTKEDRGNRIPAHLAWIICLKHL